MFFRTATRVPQTLSFDVQRRLERGESLQIIDVREPGEIASGMIPGAKHIRLSEIQARIREIDSEREAIFVCRSGNRSSYVCEYLMSQGFANVKNLMGGMLAWEGDLAS